LLFAVNQTFSRRKTWSIHRAARSRPLQTPSRREKCKSRNFYTIGGLLRVSLATRCRALTEREIQRERKTDVLREAPMPCPLDRLPFCFTVRKLVKIFIIKTGAVRTPYLYDFTYDLFLPNDLRIFREPLVLNLSVLEHSSKPKDKRDNDQDGHYHEENPEQGKHRIERRKHVSYHTIIGYTGHI